MAHYDVCAAGDLVPDAPLTVAAGTSKVLLVRRGSAIHAVGAICPHAGADLSEGVLQGDRITCPWHKASFDIRDGACTAPPAVDHLPCFAATERDGRVFVTLPGTIRQAVPAAPSSECIAIVGAGAAGSTAAVTLRQDGFGGRVVLIGEEAALPYDRTLLSKYTLSGLEGGEKTPLHTGFFYNHHRIERRTGTVIAIDPATRTLRLADGGAMRADQILVATGGTPKRPQLRNLDLPGLFTLRTAQDAEAIVAAAQGAERCVVLGAGFIGMEAAASLRERGLDVTVVDPAATPFARFLGAKIGGALAGLHREHGIRFCMGRKAVALHGEQAITGVELDDGTVLPAQLVVAGLGITPAAGLLAGDGDGITVDATLQAAPGIYAAGDIAAFPLYGAGQHVRVEHWRVAQQHGEAAARAMLGHAAPFTAVPYVWTIHFHQRLDYVGHAEKWDQVVTDGEPDRHNFLAFYVAGGRVAALAGMHRDRQMAAAIGLFEQRQDWAAEALLEALAEWE